MSENTVDIVLPKWGTTMQEAEIMEVHVAVGQTVAEGDPIVAVETDKVETDVESPYAGVIAEVRVQAGDVVPVGAVLAVVRR